VSNTFVTTVRFNLDKEEDCRALDYLQGEGRNRYGSYTQAIITALNAGVVFSFALIPLTRAFPSQGRQPVKGFVQIYSKLHLPAFRSTLWRRDEPRRPPRSFP